MEPSVTCVITGSDPASGKLVFSPAPEVAALLAPDMPPPSSMPWASVTGKPTFFDGQYGSLSGKPTLGTAAATAATDYATAAQGTKADTALQNAAAFATAAQGTKADSAIQPAGMTKAAVGLGNADNTSDANKPVSTATQTALNGKLATNGTATTVTTNANMTGDVTSVGNATTYAGVVPFAKGGRAGAAATSATTGTMTVAMDSSVKTITPTGNCTFNASGGVAGQITTFCITTAGVSSFTLTWGTNYRKTGTLATGTTAARFFAVTFLCVDGTVWQEIARTAVQT